MEVAIELFDKFGIQALGWAIALFLGWKFFGKWDGNISKLTDNVTELTKIVAVLSEKVSNNEDDIFEIKNQLSGKATVRYGKHNKQ